MRLRISLKPGFLPILRKMSTRPTAPNQFLNGDNYNQLLSFTRQHYAKKLGTQAIPERMDNRLKKTVQHYMEEVARIQGTTKPAKALNQEVLREVVTDMDSYLKRQEPPAAAAITSVGSLPRNDEMNKLFEDPASRYEQMMAERAPPPLVMPAVPDFRNSSDMIESNEDPVLLMQRMQKARDEQARGMGLAGPPPRLEIREEPPSAAQPVPPQAEPAPPPLAPRPQDYIIPQEDIVKYRETEYNIFLTSSDRDWLRNNTENRYNFSVNFNTGSKKTGFNFNPALQERFRNIQRIEFVKVIMPIESLRPLVRVVNNTPTYDVTRVINVFSLPFAGVRIAELNNNGFSTNPYEDNTFAIVQYDTTWSSDLLAPASTGGSVNLPLTKSGYTGFIPKFLKTQKVYTPTPLATLQRLSIRVERHSGDLLSEDSDVQFINRICMSSTFSAIGTNSTIYADAGSAPQNSYIFIQTAKYFSFSAVSEGDNIQIQGYAPVTVSSAATQFASFINNEAGLYVVATGYTSGSAMYDGRNNAGYCNVIIVRNQFDDPTTGSVGRTASYVGGSSSAESTFATALNAEASQTNAALINLSRQTHIVLRVITRDMDSQANIRPDNV